MTQLPHSRASTHGRATDTHACTNRELSSPARTMVRVMVHATLQGPALPKTRRSVDFLVVNETETHLSKRGSGVCCYEYRRPNGLSRIRRQRITKE